MKGGGGDAFVRADQIDLKSLDEQLERRLNRPRTTEKRKEEERQREEWEIDPTKLVIKGVIARGTFGTVHRGVYDGQDLLDWGEEGNRTEAEISALRAAFSQEVSVWHKLDHPNVTKIVHRDVKTENMLLDRTGTVKIADFGVARIEAQNPNDMTGETGTLGYMAPEV
ncbi:hypothetical protein B296_00017450 [Ensete ventricosum]|uniref:Protein kinase domain-containing protein n=1 Tax=Ensete ventricosum TaxID=4639 RepID=A0A427AGL8_ENSVE|nr:hypothetical protein B296_00017450 [Ensete ventricosum]